MDQRKRDVAKKGLARKPQQDRAVFANGPEHGQVFKIGVGLAQNINGLAFEFFEMRHKEEHYTASPGKFKEDRKTGVPPTSYS